MASPQLHLLEMLQFPGVTRETCAVLTTLLRRCADDHSLSVYVLGCVDENLQGHGLNLVALKALWDSSHCMLMKQQLVSLVADALNSEASRWIYDFLLIAIGKRKHQRRMSPSHPFVRQVPPEKCHPARRDLEEKQDLDVRLRDGSRCSISGSIHSVVCAQLIPFSDDIERLVRFRVLARVFFQEESPLLSDAHLQSPENALRLSMYWKDRLDRGLLILRCIDGEFHVIPISRDDSDTLAEERRSNGLQGPSLVELHGGMSAGKYPRLSPQLAVIHQAITEAWLETGLSDRMLQKIDYADSLPKSRQSISRLGQRRFSWLLKHRLGMM